MIFGGLPLGWPSRVVGSVPCHRFGPTHRKAYALLAPGGVELPQSACRAARTSSAGSGRRAPGVSIVSRWTVPLNTAGGE